MTPIGRIGLWALGGMLAASCGFDTAGSGGGDRDDSGPGIDAAPPGTADGAPIDGGMSMRDAGEEPVDCATACAGIGTCQGKVCVIECGDDGECGNRIDCPAGVACRVVCSGPGSCAGGVDCGEATECTVECSSNDTCANEIRCGNNLPCTVTCSGQNSCVNGVTCDEACACRVECTGSSSCDDDAVCPTGCDDGKGCTDAEPVCDTCIPL